MDRPAMHDKPRLPYRPAARQSTSRVAGRRWFAGNVAAIGTKQPQDASMNTAGDTVIALHRRQVQRLSPLNHAVCRWRRWR